MEVIGDLDRRSNFFLFVRTEVILQWIGQRFGVEEVKAVYM